MYSKHNLLCNLHFLVLLNSLCDFYFYFPCYKMPRLMSDIPLKRECRLSGSLFSSNTPQCMPRKQNYIWKMTLTSADLYHSFRPLFCLQGNGTYAQSLCLYKSCQSNGYIWTDRASACLRNYPRHSICMLQNTHRDNSMINTFKCSSNILHVFCPLAVWINGISTQQS